MEAHGPDPWDRHKFLVQGVLGAVSAVTPTAALVFGWKGDRSTWW